MLCVFSSSPPPSSQHLAISPPSRSLSAQARDATDCSVRPHEGPGADTLLIKQEPKLSIMAVTQPGLSVTCFHCQASGESCRIDAGSARHCLVAQGWFRSPTGRKIILCVLRYWVLGRHRRGERHVRPHRSVAGAHRRTPNARVEVDPSSSSRDATSAPQRHRAGTRAHGQPPRLSGGAPAVSDCAAVARPRVALAWGGRGVALTSGLSGSSVSGKQAHTSASSTQAPV